MFPSMRRSRQALSREACLAVLQRATSGVLSLQTADGYPYGVPLSFVYDGEKLYFHCAKTGYKLDALRYHDKVSFCVIDQDQVVPEAYTTYFRSVILFGRARILTQPEEARQALEKLAEKYSPQFPQGRQEEIDRLFSHVCMVELTIDHMTGKQAKELL
jgi:nitroimidazol reductase NimA-like FMN-containing flavoprotein (pyridoxamine 5'-phosphate oxidase superfamily)